MANDYYASVTGSQSCSSSRWLTEEVYKLIDMVQHDEAIYNPRHKYYFCRPYVETFWREVDQKLEKNPGASLAKWTNLRISFRREYTNYLEEKVPPCWTYFDRMFFLHPYLRKKQSQPKSLDSQVQDALERISSFSNRFHRERTATAATVNTAATLSSTATTGGDMQSAHISNQPTQQQLDNYLDYFDDPDQNISDELDDVIDDDQQRRRPPNFRHSEIRHQLQDDHDQHALNNDIKSECDVKSDVDEYESESVVRQEEVDNELLEEMEMRSFMMDSYANNLGAPSTANSIEDKRAHHVRMQHLMRLQQKTREFQEDQHLRVKRPRSQESISSTQMNNSCVGSGSTVTTNVTHTSSSSLPSNISAASSSGSSMGGGQARMHYSTTSTASIHANVSFVRPTLAKPVDVVSTTTSNNGSVGLSFGAPVPLSSNMLSNSSNNANININAATTSNASQQLTPSSSSTNQRHNSTNNNNQNHNSHHHHHHSGSSASGSSANHHRLEFTAITSGAASNHNLPANGVSAVSTSLMSSPPIAGAPVAPTHIELCDCKTDPDAMFLMSLLPDIQKLNGRDRGKIKIAFQNILQDYLYPD
ncbi:myb-like protein U [Eurosta solidaginis]|uniref:myb-like protein U n=1 Tax=Eurosta solidaginis TaxID=178769 RepID=UPI0035312904